MSRVDSVNRYPATQCYLTDPSTLRDLGDRFPHRDQVQSPTPDLRRFRSWHHRHPSLEAILPNLGVRQTGSSPGGLDDAIDELVQEGDPGAIVTGWVLSSSVKHPTMPRGDGHISLNSEGLPYHSQIGLLHAALEEKNNQILVNIFLEAGRG